MLYSHSLFKGAESGKSALKCKRVCGTKTVSQRNTRVGIRAEGYPCAAELTKKQQDIFRGHCLRRVLHGGGVDFQNEFTLNHRPEDFFDDAPVTAEILGCKGFPGISLD